MAHRNPIDTNESDIEKIELEIEENIENWIRKKYHFSLKEEISTEIINWIRTRYAIWTIIIGLAALFGANEYFSVKIEQKAGDAIEKRLEKYNDVMMGQLTALQSTIADVKNRGDILNIALEKAEAKNILLQEFSNQLSEKLINLDVQSKDIVNKFAKMDAKMESSKILIDSLLTRAETRLMRASLSQIKK